MSSKRTDRRDGRRQEAEERNAKANVSLRLCGHKHGEGVDCSGRSEQQGGQA